MLCVCSPSRSLFRALAVACLAAALPSVATGQQVPDQGAEGVVLLRNGQILTGRISMAPDGYVVRLPGGEIRLKAMEVEQAAESLVQIYERMRGGVMADDALGHLRLANWCLKQGLSEQAAAEVDAASRLDGNSPMISAFQRRLQTMQTQPASHSAHGQALPNVNSEDLDRVVRNLPPGTVEAFTQRVQPLLVNSCLTSGCHSSGDDAKFQLLRVPSGRPASRRLTQRNLYAALQLIDCENPAESKLLKIPVAAHGTLKSPMFTDPQSPQYRRLVEWVYQVASHAPPELAPQTRNSHVVDAASGPIGHVEPISVFGNNNFPTATPVSANMPSQGTQVPTAAAAMKAQMSAAEPAKRPVGNGSIPDAASIGLGDGDRGPKDAAARAKRGAAESKPGDPFDAEQFNRRYHGESR